MASLTQQYQELLSLSSTWIKQNYHPSSRVSSKVALSTNLLSKSFPHPSPSTVLPKLISLPKVDLDSVAPTHKKVAVTSKKIETTPIVAPSTPDFFELKLPPPPVNTNFNPIHSWMKTYSFTKNTDVQQKLDTFKDNINFTLLLNDKLEKEFSFWILVKQAIVERLRTSCQICSIDNLSSIHKEKMLSKITYLLCPWSILLNYPHYFLREYRVIDNRYFLHSTALIPLGEAVLYQENITKKRSLWNYIKNLASHV